LTDVGAKKMSNIKNTNVMSFLTGEQGLKKGEFLEKSIFF
jgi:hypothetical protein